LRVIEARNTNARDSPNPDGYFCVYAATAESGLDLRVLHLAVYSGQVKAKLPPKSRLWKCPRGVKRSQSAWEGRHEFGDAKYVLVTLFEMELRQRCLLGPSHAIFGHFGAFLGHFTHHFSSKL
jgi:hypothetical protein